MVVSKDISETNLNISAMSPDELEVFLKSTEPDGDYNPEVTLRITAYLRGSDVFEPNTLTFHCDPVGSNYRTSYLQVTLNDWSKIIEIRDFLANSFADNTIDRRALTIEVEDGTSSITPFGESPNETEGIEEITIEVSQNRIEFQRSATVMPYIFTHSVRVDGDPQDNINAEKLLNFFDTIVAVHPDYEAETGGSDSANQRTLDELKVEQLLSEVVPIESDLYSDYQKAVREYDGGEYADAIRDVGRCVETLVEMVALEVYDEDDISDKTARRINALDKSSDGIPSYIGKASSTVWWLRNKAAHPNEYEIGEEDAHYALISFEVATEKFVNDYLD